MWSYRIVTYWVRTLYLCFIFSREEAGIAMGCQWRQLRFLCRVARSLELLTSLSLSSFSVTLSFPGIEEGTGDQCETLRNCTWRPGLAHLFSVIMFFFATTLLTKASFLSSFSFSLRCLLLSLSLISGNWRRDRRLMWGSEKRELTM